ncbi:MAG: N-6 DNA methylase [Ardenticatenaceae bacterium]|nr:N-6 DNA methylase [Ardenticatenaceae bacterium]
MRLANIDKAGYFPTPEPVTNLIRTYIAAPNGGRILDPCAGEGEALIPLARDLNLIPYGVELAASRAGEAQRNVKALIASRPDADQLTGRHVLQDSFMAMITPKESFNFIYANPPYLMTENGRAEYAWLRDTRPFLQPGGLMIWVIPRHMLHYDKTAPYLVSWYENIQIFRFPDPFYERFKQVIVFGTLRASRISPENEQVREIRKLGQPIQVVDLDPLVATPEPVYTLPALTLPQAQMRFRGWNVSLDDAGEEAHAKGVIQSKEFRAIVAPETGQGPKLRPVMPMKIGHLVGVIAAGFLNNQILQDGDERILIKGLSYKRKNVTVTQQVNPNPDPDSHAYSEITTGTDQVITSITTINQQGTVAKYEGKTLNAFMERWLPILTQVVSEQFPPLYNFDYNGYEAAINKLNMGRKIPIVNRPGMLPAQKHAVAATATRLETAKDAWMDGEMGTGKTIMGAAVAAVMASKGFKMDHIIVLCPPHLVNKWQREIKHVWPRAQTMALTSRADVDKFFNLPGPIFGVMKETTARSGSGWAHAYQSRLGILQHKPRTQEGKFEFIHAATFVNGQAQKVLPDHLHKRLADLRGKRHLRCPVCAHVPVDDEGVPLTPGDFTNGQKYCKKCGSALYQESRRYAPSQKPTTFKQYAWRETRFLNGNPAHTPPENEGYARYPLATYIKRHYKGKLDLLIADECHQYKAADSDRGYAYHRLAVAAQRILNLTGTTYGGKASTLFSLLYRSSSEMRHAYAYEGGDGLKKWVEQYGIMQEITEVKYDQNGMETGNNRSKTRVKELPGASPAMLPWLLNRAVFVSLKDMGMALPSYQEIPVGVYMTSDQQNLYDEFADTLHKEMAERLQRNDKSLLGAYLQALLSWPDSPWRAKRVVDQRRLKNGHTLDESTIAAVPALPANRLYPKEEEIIELIKAEKKEGRRTLLLCQQTSTLDITPQWVKMLEAEGLKASVLKVEPNKREAWVKQQVKANVDVIITHPKRVETGLDLLDFPTIIWMGTEYSVYTILQASRRSWRIGQDRPVKVYYFYYEETLQAQAIRLIAAKVGAAMRVRGDTLPEDSITEMDDLASADMMTELTRIALQGGAADQVESLQDLFAKANADIQHEEVMVGGFDAQAIYNDLGEEPEPEPQINATPVNEASFKTGSTLVGPGGMIEQTKRSTPPEGKRLVFGYGLVDEADADRLMNNGPETQPEVKVTKARIVPTRNGVQAVPIPDPEPEVVADVAPPAAAPATNEKPANPTIEQMRLVFGLDKPEPKKKRRTPTSTAGVYAPTQMAMF